MARVFNLDTAAEEIRKNLARSFQSANVNFLIGSGASYPQYHQRELWKKKSRASLRRATKMQPI